MSQVKFDILIVGGGLAGFGAAVGLCRKGHQVTVLERAHSLQTFGGGLLVPPNAARVLVDYGVYADLEAVGSRYNTQESFGRDGTLLDIVDGDALAKRYSNRPVNIHRLEYQRLLYNAAVKEGAQVRFGCLVASVDESTPSVVLESGEKLTADIVIGADGIRSKVRTAVLSNRIVEPLPESTAFQFYLPAEVVKNSPETSSLVIENTFKSWYGPGSQIICAPYDGGKTLSVWYGLHNSPVTGKPINTGRVSEANSQDASTHKIDFNLVQQDAKKYERRIQLMCDMVDPDNVQVWNIGYLPPLSTWVSRGGKVTILGDAAHAMVPHLGQGAAMVIEDGGCLAECLDWATSKDNIPALLHAYEQIRKPRTDRIQAAALVTGKWKVMEDGPAQRKRDERWVKRLDKSSPTYDADRAGGAISWIYDYDCLATTKQELAKLFGQRAVGIKKAHL